MFSLDDAKGLVIAGIDGLVHSIRDRDVDQALIDGMRANDVFYVPTLVAHETAFSYADAPDWVGEPAMRATVAAPVIEWLTSDTFVSQAAMNPAMNELRDQYATAQRNLKALIDAGVTIGLGTDSGTSNRFPGYMEHRSTSAGIVVLVVGEGSLNVIFGALVVSFTSAAIGCAVIVAVLLGRRARTARLQADLLANVSHELRTPLSAIRMYAQTLEMGLIDSDVKLQKQCVETILRESEWLEAMIERLLTWRSIAKDRDDLDLVCAPIRDVVDESAGHFMRMFSPGEVEFMLDNACDAPVSHDKRGLKSIILNLLINAWKYTGDEKIIELEVSRRDGSVVISVSDNGHGIPEREVHRIFEPFYRVESKAHGNAPGAGLGLAIVSHLVKAHSGSITVETSADGGSRFLISLPISEEETPAP